MALGSYENYREGITKDNNITDTSQRGLEMIFGGPIGWYEAITGKKVLSNNVQDALGWYPNYEEMNDKDVYDSMSDSDWKEFRKGNAGDRQNFVNQRKAELAPIKAEKDKQLAAENLSKQKEAEYQKWRKDMMLRLDAVSKEMGMSVEELIRRGDLGVMNAGATARSQAGSAAYRAGLGHGGISAMNTQRAVTDAQAKYQLQRQELGLQATNSLLGQMGQVGQEAEDKRRYEQNLNLQLQAAQEALRQRRHAEGQSNTFGTIGAVWGGIKGGPEGAQTGYGLGSAIDKATQPSYSPKPMKYPSGLGGGYYGGSQ